MTRTVGDPLVSTDVELAYLGSISAGAAPEHEMLEKLRPEDFVDVRCRAAFEAMRSLFSEHGEIGLAALAERLRGHPAFQGQESDSFTFDLPEGRRTSSSAAQEAELLRDRSLRRAIVRVTREASNRARDLQEDPRAVLESLQSQSVELEPESRSRRAIDMRDAVAAAFDFVDTCARSGEGLPFPFSRLNDVACLREGELTVIAGRPSMGKTSFAMNCVTRLALEEKVPIAFFSLEVECRRIALNALASVAGVEVRRLVRGRLSDAEFRALASAGERVSSAPIFLDDSVRTMPQLRARARRLKAKNGIGLIIVDYLQLLAASGKHENRTSEVGAISRELKALAMDLGIPLIAISQLSRAVESRADRRPCMADLRESGAIEQDADLILLLYREDYYHGDRAAERGTAEVIIAKQRNGPTGSCKLRFDPAILRFSNYYGDGA